MRSSMTRCVDWSDGRPSNRMDAANLGSVAETRVVSREPSNEPNKQHDIHPIDEIGECQGYDPRAAWVPTRVVADVHGDGIAVSVRAIVFAVHDRRRALARASDRHTARIVAIAALQSAQSGRVRSRTDGGEYDRSVDTTRFWPGCFT